MTDRAQTDARRQIDNLLARQAEERRDLVRQLEEAEAAEAKALREAVREDAGHALSEAISDLERQLRADGRAGDLHATLVTDLPAWTSTSFVGLDPDERAEGKREVNIYVPRADADGHRLPVAFALFDCSDSIFGRSSRVRADREMADRTAEVEAERERNAREWEAERARR